LIKSGANVNAVCLNEIPLHRAIINENLEIIQLLVENGSNINGVYYHGYRNKILEFMIKRGMPSSRPNILKFGNREQILKLGTIKLDEAFKSLNATKAYKGDINATYNDMTLLHWAVRKNDLEWVRYLLKRGANQFIKDRQGCVAINYYYTVRKEIYYLLRDSINEPNVDGEITINQIKSKPLQKYLISIGADYTKIKDVDFVIERNYNCFVRDKSKIW
jgi:ankyrin repeat protein